MTRKALGRGLNALLHTVETTSPAGLGEVAVEIGLQRPDAFGQRRVRFEQADKWLADAVRKKHVRNFSRMR